MASMTMQHGEQDLSLGKFGNAGFIILGNNAFLVSLSYFPNSLMATQGGARRKFKNKFHTYRGDRWGVVWVLRWNT